MNKASLMKIGWNLQRRIPCVGAGVVNQVYYLIHRL